MPLFERLIDKYVDRDVAIVHIYFREPHPGESVFKQYAQHKDDDQKMAYARELVDKKNITAPVIVDGVDEKFQEMIGGLPNMVYVIAKDGTIHYKSSWADADKVDRALAELLTAEDPSNPVVPTFETQDFPIDI